MQVQVSSRKPSLALSTKKGAGLAVSSDINKGGVKISTDITPGLSVSSKNKTGLAVGNIDADLPKVSVANPCACLPSKFFSFGKARAIVNVIPSLGNVKVKTNGLGVSANVDLDPGVSVNAKNTSLSVGNKKTGRRVSVKGGAGLSVSADTNVDVDLPNVQVANVSACSPSKWFSCTVPQLQIGFSVGNGNGDEEEEAEGEEPEAEEEEAEAGEEEAEAEEE